MDKKYSEIFRFLIVGASNAIISYFIFISLFSFLLLNVISSQSLSYGGGLIWSYILNRTWTFGSENKSGITDKVVFFRFLISQLILLCASTLSIYFLIQHLRVNAAVSWLLVMSFITIINFLALKHCVFKSNRLMNPG
ncbi:MAG: putative flippase GtrA [Paraglaciecola sp.]|jgi:putative flippase GtrA